MKTNSTTVAHISLEHYVASFRIQQNFYPTVVFNLQRSLFIAMCSRLSVNDLINNEYYLQTNVQMRRSYSKFLPHPCHHVSEQQMGCVTYLLAMKQSNNVHVHRSFKVGVFSLASEPTPHRLAIVVPLCIDIASDDALGSPMYARQKLISWLANFPEMLIGSKS